MRTCNLRVIPRSVPVPSHPDLACPLFLGHLPLVMPRFLSLTVLHTPLHLHITTGAGRSDPWGARWSLCRGEDCLEVADGDLWWPQGDRSPHHPSSLSQSMG